MHSIAIAALFAAADDFDMIVSVAIAVGLIENPRIPSANKIWQGKYILFAMGNSGQYSWCLFKARQFKSCLCCWDIVVLVVVFTFF